MLAADVPVIQKVDPTKAVKVDGKIVQTTPDTKGLQQALDNIRATGASMSESENSATPRKGTKNRRKA
jgi:hypothetical protein